MRCVRLQNCVLVCARVILCRVRRGPRPACRALRAGPLTQRISPPISGAFIGKPPVRGVLSGRLRAARFSFRRLLSLSFAAACAFPDVAHLCPDRNSGLPCTRGLLANAPNCAATLLGMPASIHDRGRAPYYVVAVGYVAAVVTAYFFLAVAWPPGKIRERPSVQICFVLQRCDAAKFYLYIFFYLLLCAVFILEKQLAYLVCSCAFCGTLTNHSEFRNNAQWSVYNLSHRTRANSDTCTLGPYPAGGMFRCF